MPESTTNFDVIVIGAGPTGLACAIECGKRDMTVACIEKGSVVNSLYNYPVNMTFFTTPELLEIGGLPMTAVRDKPTRGEALKYYRRAAEHYKLDIRQYTRVSDIVDSKPGDNGENAAFTIAATDRLDQPVAFTAKKVIIATGYYDLPVLMGVPGEDLPKVIHYYKEPHPFYDCDIAVVGGKNSAAITALECHRAGARVTLIHRQPELSPKVKYWIRPDIENRIASGEIAAFLDSTIVEITESELRIKTPGGPVTLKNDFVLAMTGYRPDTDFLARAGIVFDPEERRPRTNPDTLESDRPGVYLAGVIVAGMHTNEIFIENGRFHGEQIAASIAALLKK